MLQLSRMADYAVVTLGQMAQSPEGLHTAPALAESTGLGTATVSKVLKLLTRAALLTSSRGAQGGYHLALPPAQMTLAQIIEAIDGPIALTRCVSVADACPLATNCALAPHWQTLSSRIRGTLAAMTLAEVIQPHAQLQEAAA